MIFFYALLKKPRTPAEKRAGNALRLAAVCAVPASFGLTIALGFGLHNRFAGVSDDVFGTAIAVGLVVNAFVLTGLLFVIFNAIAGAGRSEKPTARPVAVTTPEPPDRWTGFN